MVQNNLVRIVVGLSLLLFVTVPVFGQAVLGVATSQPPAADIGVTELAGEVVLTVLSGITVQAPLAIEYSALITNNSAAEIKIFGTLGFAGMDFTPTINTDSHTVVINVPAGGVTGAQIHINGVRVDVADQGSMPVTATVTSLTTHGNAISAGQQTGPVIGQITGPFVIDQSNPPLSFVNGTETMPHTSFLVSETYTSAFTDDVGELGQTVPTRIRITPFPEVPKGVKVTFSVTAASTESGATFRTLSGHSETVPREDGSTSVTYEYTSAPGSIYALETFKIYVSMEVEPTAGSGTIAFQAAIVPIGVAVPTTQFPSTAIPRYLEREVPDESDLITGSVELAFPFQTSQSGTYTGIAITNPLNFKVNVDLAAYDADGILITGKGISNPVRLTMPRRGQIAQVATELFGIGFNASRLGTIRVIGQTPVLVGFYLLGEESGTKLDGTTAEVDPVNGWIWPTVFHETPTPFNTYEFFNPGTSAAKARLSLFDSDGHLVAEGSQTVAAGGTAVRNLADVFAGVDLNSFTGGYVKGSSDFPLVATQAFGNARESNVLQGQLSIQKQTYYFAQFASGGGYETEINIVNVDRSVLAKVTLTAVGDDGTAFPITANPAAISIPAGLQWTRTVADLFPGLGGSLTTGYIKVEVEPYLIGPFVTVPLLVGSVRFSSADGYGSAALPLFLPPSGQFIFSQVAQAQGFFTGVAMMNPNAQSAEFTLEVFRQNGALVGSHAGSLEPGEKISRLVYQLVPASGGQVGGYVRVSSDLPLVSFSLFGTDDGLSLSAIPPQQIGRDIQ